MRPPPRPGRPPALSGREEDRGCHVADEGKPRYQTIANLLEQELALLEPGDTGRVGTRTREAVWHEPTDGQLPLRSSSGRGPSRDEARVEAPTLLDAFPTS